MNPTASAPTSEPPSGKRWLADASLLTVTLIWGVTFPVVKDALQDAGPLSFNALRLTAAALLLWAYCRTPLHHLDRRTWGVGTCMGALLGLGYALQTMGLNHVAPAVSAFLTSLSVVMVPLMLAWGWKRRLAPAVWIGSALALGGLYLLLSAPGQATGAWMGYVLTGLCAVAFALQIVILGEWAPHLNFRDVTVVEIGAAALVTWLMLPMVETPHWHFSPRLWMALAVTAVLATAVAFLVQSWAQQFTPATHTALIFAFEPVFAWLAALVGWHEALRPAQLAGAVLIVVAMVVVERR